MPPPPGEVAAPVDGVTPGGSPVSFDTSATVGLLFLTGSCRPCQAYWSRWRAQVPVALVTPDPSTEDRRRVAKLAAGVSVPVVMSTAAWLAYGVTKAPSLIAVRDGRIVAHEQAPEAVSEALVILDRLTMG